MKQIAQLSLFFLIISCSSSLKNEKISINIETDFANKFPTYEFVSSIITKEVRDSLEVSITFKKPSESKPWVDNWIYVKIKGNWILKETGEKRIINPLPPLQLSSLRYAKKLIAMRHIEIDTIIYVDHIMKNVVMDLKYGNKPITDTAYIPEGAKITLYVSSSMYDNSQ